MLNNPETSINFLIGLRIVSWYPVIAVFAKNPNMFVKSLPSLNILVFEPSPKCVISVAPAKKFELTIPLKFVQSLNTLLASVNLGNVFVSVIVFLNSCCGNCVKPVLANIPSIFFNLVLV